MNTHELLELAALDAMGVLDAEERETFERAFGAASPAVQAQVRREQLRISRMNDLLPAVDPPIGLKARVLAAVREAIGTVSPLKLPSAAPRLQPVKGVHRLWRAAAVGSLAAAVVLGFSTLRIRTDYQALEDTMASNATSDLFLREFGPKFDNTFFDSSTKMLAFATAPNAGIGRGGKATLLLDPTNRRGQLFVKDLPAGDTPFELVLTGEDGSTQRVVLTFSAQQAGIKVHAIDNISLEGVTSIAIRRVGEVQAVLVAQIA